VKTVLARTMIFVTFAISVALCMMPDRAALGQTKDIERTAAELINQTAQAAIDNGLAFLAWRQHEDGAFGSAGYKRNVAVSALSAMAMMSSGSTPGRGPYGAEIEKCVKFLLDNTRDSGYVIVEENSGRGPMYGHGFATLFLAEAYGMTRQPAIREKLGKAVRLIVVSQNEQGGWRYRPQSLEADLSVTVCQIMALRAARNAGIHVPTETVERCIDYVKRSQNEDGGFMYMLDGGESEFPRSAAGIVVLYSAGVYQSDETTRGLEYLVRFTSKDAAFNREKHFFYGHYYAVQAMWHAGSDHWQPWYGAIRDVLVERQRDDGSWMDSICPEYGTAMACLILQMPNNVLPIFQR